jgi:hypothetical protein
VKILKTKFLVALALALSLAGVVYSQVSITEIEGILQLRANNPQIRTPGGAITVRDYTGTSIVPLAAAAPAIVTTAAERTLTLAECGAVVVGNATSGTQTFTLPAVATSAGCMFTFIAGHASGEVIFIAAEAGTDCIFTNHAAVGADKDTEIVTEGDCETGIQNTAGTNAIGDSLTIISDGTRWLGVAISSGIWAVVT